MGKVQNHFYKVVEEAIKEDGKEQKIRIIQQKLYLHVGADIVQLLFFQEKAGTDVGYQATPEYSNFERFLSFDNAKVDTMLASALALARASSSSA